MIIDIKSNEKFDKNSMGNKAFQLNQLYRLGFPICRGFVISPKIFDKFCQFNNIHIMDDNLKVLIQNGKFDSEIVDNLTNDFENLKKHTGEVIVRSSTSDEDSKNKSYAGIYKSVKNVKTMDQLLSAIKEVWSSYYSKSSEYYRKGKLRSSMPVLIQEMIFCDKSGVVFTRNPVSNIKECIIEACSGNNEKIIMNELRAKQYIQCNKKSLRNKLNLPNGLLSKKELRQLYRIAQSLENKFKFPCDIEWGIKDRKILLFQIRPVVYKPDMDIFNVSKDSTLNCILLDRYANPASVCYLSLLNAWQNQVYLSYYNKKPGKCFEEQPLCFIHNRVYWNVKYQKSMFEDEGSKSVFHKLKFDFLVRYGYKSWYKRLAKYDKYIEKYKELIKKTDKVVDLNLLLNQVINNFCGYIGIDHFRFLGIAQILYKKLEQDLEEDGYRKEDIYKIIGNKTNLNKTVSANKELLELVKILNQDERLKALFINSREDEIWEKLKNKQEFVFFISQFQAFVDKHGHRGVDCDDLYFPHWNEDRTNIIVLLKQYIKNGITLDETQGTEMTYKNIKFKKLIHLTGEYMCLRENQRYYFDKSWVLIRQILLKIAEYYKVKHLIKDSQEIFHMTIDEIQDGIMYPEYIIDREVIFHRKMNYEKANKSIPPYMLKDSINLPVQKNTRSTSYKVLGVSNGKAVGRIKIINSLYDLGDIRNGDIGIVKTFHPSWTPILKVLSGLIMNYGNMLSHGAVVAREYRIPVVVFNGDAATVLREGDMVEINASTGRIKILHKVEK